MTKRHIPAICVATLTLALGFALTQTTHLGPAAHFIPTAHAANTIISGDLFYTTFQTQGGPAGPNVYRVNFVYDDSPSLTLTGDCLVASLNGADALIFDPNDPSGKTLLVGEQSANAVASLTVATSPGPCASSGIVEKAADGSVPISKGNGQAYGLTAQGLTHLWVMPNDPNPKPNFINVMPLPLAAGVATQVTGADTNIRGVAFIGTQGYYGDSLDNFTTGPLVGHFGTISNSLVTARVPVIDDFAHGTTDINGSLPTHGIEFDPYSGCIIASGSNQIWQICGPGVAGAPALPAGTFHVMAKIVTADTVGGTVQVCKSPGATFCNWSNWDQASFDGNGHMFAANNNGDLYFKDYKTANPFHLITDGTFFSEQYLKVNLDDIANGGGAPPPPLTLACPASTGTVGTPYTGSLVATGGKTPYTFSIFAGLLPPPLLLNATTGAITGTPTTAGTFTFTGKVTDSTSGTALTKTSDCSIVITPSTLGCVLTPGGYKNHFNYKVNFNISFVVNGTTYTYTPAQITTIISTGGGGSKALGRSLFTALLNVHYGAFAPAPIPADIIAAEALYVQGQGSDTLNTDLDNFNNGLAPGGPTQECTQ